MVGKVGKPCFPMLVLCGMSVGDTGVVSEILYSLQDGQRASSCECARACMCVVRRLGLTGFGHAPVDGSQVLPFPLVHLLLHLVDAGQVQGPQASLA